MAEYLGYRVRLLHGLIASVLALACATTWSQGVVPVIAPGFIEKYEGTPGFRFMLRNVRLEGQGNVIELPAGGTVSVTMELLHDCRACGNAVNQVIVGLAGEPRRRCRSGTASGAAAAACAW